MAAPETRVDHLGEQREDPELDHVDEGMPSGKRWDRWKNGHGLNSLSTLDEKGPFFNT